MLVSKKLLKNALTANEARHVVSFIVNCAEAHAMSLCYLVVYWGMPGTT